VVQLRIVEYKSCRGMEVYKLSKSSETNELSMQRRPSKASINSNEFFKTVGY
jgi:hypothetical protein